MDKQPVGQLPDLTQSNNDDEIMVITNDEYNQLKKEKISDFITDLTSTDENNAIVKGTDGKLFVTDFGNASNITEGTLPVSVLPDIPKDKLPPIETADLPVSGVTADTYAYPSSVTVNAQGQVTAIEAGEPGANNANQDLSNISEAGKEVIRETAGTGLPVGTIFSHTCSASFVPENSLPCDGSEYTSSQFPSLYTSWLVDGKLNTCTYEEYQSDIDTYGKCAKFGLDSTSGKFKVPTIPDGTHIQQAMSDDELGKSYNAGLPNIKGSADINRLGYNAEGSVTGAFGLGASNEKPSAVDTRLEDINTVLKFDASLSNPIYSDDVNTVQTEAVALRYFVVVATGSINQSEIDWSEWATGLQGKLNVDHSNDTKPYITETYHNGESGYVVYSNGLCEQWGFATSTTNPVVVTLLKKMDPRYNVQITSTWAVVGVSKDAQFAEKTSNSFKVYKQDTNALFCWFIKGYTE